MKRTQPINNMPISTCDFGRRRKYIGQDVCLCGRVRLIRRMGQGEVEGWRLELAIPLQEVRPRTRRRRLPLRPRLRERAQRQHPRVAMQHLHRTPPAHARCRELGRTAALLVSGCCVQAALVMKLGAHGLGFVTPGGCLRLGWPAGLETREHRLHHSQQSRRLRKKTHEVTDLSISQTAPALSLKGAASRSAGPRRHRPHVDAA
jgi:hypothetical protein